MRTISGCETGCVPVCIGTANSQKILRFEPNTLAENGVLATIPRVVHRLTLNPGTLPGAAGAKTPFEFPILATLSLAEKRANDYQVDYPNTRSSWPGPMTSTVCA
jgi:hypothetical protein